MRLTSLLWLLSAVTTVHIGADGTTKLSLQVSPNPVSDCVSREHAQITVNCSIAEGDVSDVPYFCLYVQQTLMANAIGTPFNKTYRISSTFGITKQNTNIRCTATRNSCNNSSIAEANEHVIVLYPPSDPPSLKINGENVTGKETVLTQGTTYTATCDVRGGNPNNYTLTLTCPGHVPVTLTGTSVTTDSIVVVTSYNGKMCSCDVEHISQCDEAIHANVEIVVPFGPRAVSLLSPSYVQLCDGLTEFDVTCSVSRDHVSSQPLFEIFQQIDSYYLYHNKPVDVVIKNSTVYKMTSTVQINKRDSPEFTLKCRVTNAHDPVLFDLTSQKIHVSGQQFGSPILAIKSPSFRQDEATNSSSVVEGDPVKVTCSVPGADHPVTYISCGKSEVRQDSFSYVAIAYSETPVSCVCHVQISGCYDRRSIVTFNVTAKPSESGSGPSDVIIIICGLSAIVVVAAPLVIVLALYWNRRVPQERLSWRRRRRRTGKATEDHQNKEVDGGSDDSVGYARIGRSRSTATDGSHNSPPPLPTVDPPARIKANGDQEDRSVVTISKSRNNYAEPYAIGSPGTDTPPLPHVRSPLGPQGNLYQPNNTSRPEISQLNKRPVSGQYLELDVARMEEEHKPYFLNGNYIGDVAEVVNRSSIEGSDDYVMSNEEMDLKATPLNAQASDEFDCASIS